MENYMSSNGCDKEQDRPEREDLESRDDDLDEEAYCSEMERLNYPDVSDGSGLSRFSEIHTRATNVPEGAKAKNTYKPATATKELKATNSKGQKAFEGSTVKQPKAGPNVYETSNGAKHPVPVQRASRIPGTRNINSVQQRQQQHSGSGARSQIPIPVGTSCTSSRIHSSPASPHPSSLDSPAASVSSSSISSNLGTTAEPVPVNRGRSPHVFFTITADDLARLIPRTRKGFCVMIVVILCLSIAYILIYTDALTCFDQPTSRPAYQPTSWW